MYFIAMDEMSSIALPFWPFSNSVTLLLLLPAKIPHDERGKHHQDLCDLAHVEAGLIAYLLCDLALLAAENMS